MRGLFLLCCFTLSTLALISPSFAADNLSTKINSLETQISTLSGDVCGKSVPTDDNDKALFNAKKTLLQQAAKNLAALLDQEAAQITSASIPESDKQVLKDSITKKKQSLQADCPSVPAPPKASATSAPAATSTLYTLGVAGLNAMGTSSSGPSQQYFASFSLLTPLPIHSNDKDPLHDPVWAWLDPRIASVPSANSAQLSSLSSSSSLTTGLGTQKITDITQSFEFQGGLEYYPIVPAKGAPWGSARTTFSLVAGFGVETPFNSASTPTEFGLNANLAQQFKQNPSLATTYPNLATALACFTANPPTCTSASPPSQTTVAFVFPNRSRFYRDWFGGIRLRTFYYGGDDNSACSTGKKVCDIYPGTFDIRFGEDETVTSGHLIPLVMTLSGSYPFPGTQGILRIFGETHLRLKGNQNTPTLAATPSSTFTPISDPSVVVQPINPADTDYYRLGLGVDIVPLISKWISSSKNTQAQPAPTTPTTSPQ